MEKRQALLSDLLLEKWIRQRENDQLVWKTKNGDELSIKKMSDEHLKNAIEVMQKVFDIDIDDFSFGV